MRMTPSRLPIAALIWAMTLRPHWRAAFCPSSMETPPPSLPAISPLGPSEICPDTVSSEPLRT